MLQSPGKHANGLGRGPEPSRGQSPGGKAVATKLANEPARSGERKTTLLPYGNLSPLSHSLSPFGPLSEMWLWHSPRFGHKLFKVRNSISICPGQRVHQERLLPEMGIGSFGGRVYIHKSIRLPNKYRANTR